MKKYIAEMLGTMVLVLMGCGTAVSLSCTSANPDLASTVVGTALAFGLSVVAMAYAIGGISSCLYRFSYFVGADFQFRTGRHGSQCLSGRCFRNRSFAGGNSFYFCFCIGSVGYNRCKERSRQLCRTCYRSFFGAGSSRLHSLYGNFG